MATLSFRVVERIEGSEPSERDRAALEETIAWIREPRFVSPGRTAWHVLHTPIRSADGQILRAAKLKGVGAYHPGVLRGGGCNSKSEISPPSTLEYEETARTPHFGIGATGDFRIVHSEAAPFGAITVRRALQEFVNARILRDAGVPAIAPYAVYAYEGKQFRGEPIGVVVTLAPDASPYALEFLYLGESGANEEQRAHYAAVREHLGVGPRAAEGGATRALTKVGFQVGIAMRRMAQAGLYRYSAGWDNFFLNKHNGDVYLTDLDSTRQLSELSPEIRGMQVLRDLAGALYRVANKLYHPNVIDDYDLGALLDADPLASIVSGYLALDHGRAQQIVAPLWRYFVPHWFLLRRHRGQLRSLPELLRKSYKMDRDVFYSLAILTLAGPYHESRERLKLAAAPTISTLRDRLRAYLADRMDLLEFFILPRVSVA